MPTESIAELLEAGEYYFGKADEEQDIEPAVQYAILAGAGAQLALARLACELHATGLRQAQQQVDVYKMDACVRSPTSTS